MMRFPEQILKRGDWSMVWLLCGLISASHPVTAHAQDTGQTSDTAPAGPDQLEYFRIIYQNNVFDPGRRPWRPPDRREERPVVRQPQIDSVGLSGIMSYDGKFLAIFNGSSSSFQGVRNLGESIGDLKIIKVGIDEVSLASTAAPKNNDESETEGGTSYVLKIGESLTRQDEGPWKKSSGSGQPFRSAWSGSSRSSGGQSPGRSPEPAQGASGGSAAEESSNAENDILKKLLERRKQQLD